MKSNKRNICFSLCLLLMVLNLQAQLVHTIIVEIKTGDKRFAGTDDPVHLLIGGKDFNLDNSNQDDFERDNTDIFTITVHDAEFTVELIRAIGEIRIEKTGDSFWGGGWNFGGIAIRMNDANSIPLYTNNAINKWLDGDHRGWGTTLGEEGWNLPESPPFPPCNADDIIILFAPSKAVAKDSKLDSDCDGIPDDQDDIFDSNQPDDDGDGLPNRYETQNGLNPNSIDSDSDGWSDGNNIKDLLLLTKVECIDEDGTIEIGSDEIYVDVENVRFPLSEGLDNYWEMDDGTEVKPSIVVDLRVTNMTVSAPVYHSRIKLRESDITFMEKPWDNTFTSQTLAWGRNETKVIDHNEGSRHYKLHFKSVVVTFLDSDPLSASADRDGDDIADSLEFSISSQAAHLRPMNVGASTGYDGLSSPTRKDLFIEQDATSSDDNMPFDAKQQISSQFYFRNIFLKLDDGVLGGGQILPFDETVEFSELTGIKNNNLWRSRFNHYRYLLYVPSMGSTFAEHGRADRPGTKFMVSRSTMVGSFSAIVCMHELGHTLSLCHTEGAAEGPVGSSFCPTPVNYNGGCSSCCSTTSNPRSCCQHYCGVNDEDITAMGADVGAESLIIGGLVGIFLGLAIIALFIPGIGWAAGIALILGAALIGTITGFFFSDAYERIVNYHSNEWAALFFNVF